MTARIDLLQQWVTSQLPLIESTKLDSGATITVDFVRKHWTVVSGDASFRRYFRVDLGRSSYIVMDAPPEKEALNPFIEVAERMRAAGLVVPTIFARDITNGILLLEDFGDELIKGALDNAEVSETMGQQLFDQLLPVLRGMAYDCSTIGLENYSAEKLQQELALFTVWYLGRHCGLSLSFSEQGLWDELCQQLITSASDQPQVFVHRDFHSCNLHFLGADNSEANDFPYDGKRIGIIDFQDALHGPVSYDLSSWLWDRYVTWPRGDIERWMLQARNVLSPSASDLEWIKTCDWMGLQRNLKIIGIFSRLYHRDSKDGYLQMIPQFSKYVKDVLRLYPELTEHAAMLDRFLVKADDS